MNNKELIHLKVNGVIYRPQKAGVKDNKFSIGNYPVCEIKKLFFGFWMIKYFDKRLQFEMQIGYYFGMEDKPNSKIIVHSRNVEEIKYYIK